MAPVFTINSAEKRISSVDDVFSQGSYWIVNWGEGRTYFGSSGSPLYDANYGIVGQLYGGSSFCTNDANDIYGKLSSSWSGLRITSIRQAAMPMSARYAQSIRRQRQRRRLLRWRHLLRGARGELRLQFLHVVSGRALRRSRLQHRGREGALPCCLESGECLSNQTPEACADVAGNYQGDDTSCADVDCPQPEPTGACCVNGNCISDLTAGECAAGSGEYQGDGTSCDFVNCDAVGDYVEFKHVIVGENLVPGIGPNFTVDIMAAVLLGNRIDAVAGNSAQSRSSPPPTASIRIQTVDRSRPTSTPTTVRAGTRMGLACDHRRLDQTGAPFGSNDLGS